jgi:hypothetical protein
MHKSDEIMDRVGARARELTEKGLEFSHAFGRAWLEDSIKERWPSDWGDDFHVLIYGDFQPPDKDIIIESLGIVIHGDRMKNSVIKSALCVLKATVSIERQSIDAILDAARRINLLLGAWTLTTWANSACGWWSSVTHPSIADVTPPFYNDELSVVVPKLLELPLKARQRIEAALYWMRTPHRLLLNGYDIHVFRTYSNYWNAFECLVDAINMLKPRVEISRGEKQAQINDYLQERLGRITSGDIDMLYRTVVNPGFVGRAKHALQVCFGDHAGSYVLECFERVDEENRLYNVRNAINHGSVFGEDPDERLRIESRLSMLTLMLLQVFARLVPYSAPSIEGFTQRATGAVPTK